MPYNLHKQQAPGASLKIQQVHANLLVWNRNVRVLFLNMKNITFRTTLRYGVRFQGDDHLADNLSTRRKEIYQVSGSSNPSMYVSACLFAWLTITIECISIRAEISRSWPTYYTRSTTKSNTSWQKLLANTPKYNNTKCKESYQKRE